MVAFARLKLVQLLEAIHMHNNFLFLNISTLYVLGADPDLLSVDKVDVLVGSFFKDPAETGAVFQFGDFHSLLAEEAVYVFSGEGHYVLEGG